MRGEGREREMGRSGSVDAGLRSPTRYERERAQRWRYGLGALFAAVLLTAVTGNPVALDGFGPYAPEVMIAVVLLAVFTSLLLAMAGATGRRRREHVLAAVTFLFAVTHPSIEVLFTDPPVDLAVAQAILASAAVVTLAFMVVVDGVVGRVGIKVVVGVAAFGAVMQGVHRLTRAGEPDWVEASGALAVGLAALFVGSVALVVGQRRVDGAISAAGFMAASVGYGSLLLRAGDSTDLTVGVATMSVVGAVLAATASVVAVFEALHRRDAIADVQQLSRNLELARLSAEAARYEEFVHDQRSSLLAIEAATRQLRAHPSERLATAVVTEVGRLQRMLDGAAEERSMFDVADTLEVLLECLRAVHGEIDYRVVDDAPAWGHADDVSEVVQTLVDNAFDHGRGPVAVEVTRRGDQVVVAVTDHGAGVPGALHESVFGRGVTTSPRGHRGLGLYSARRLARENGADLVVASGDSGRFELRLRATAPTVALPAPHGASQLSFFSGVAGSHELSELAEISDAAGHG